MRFDDYPPFSCHISGPFANISKSEAEAFTQCYVNCIGRRVELLKQWFESNNAHFQLDCDKRNLSQLGKWFGQFVAKDAKESNGAGSESNLGDVSATLCYDLGMFIGSCLKLEFQGSSWGTFFDRPNHINHNQPVLFSSNKTKYFAPIECVLLFAYAYIDDVPKLPDLADRYDGYRQMMIGLL